MTNSIRQLIALTIAVTLAAPAALAGESLDRINSKGVIVVANDANFSPQSFINDNNEMDGFDVDVAKDVARRLGVKVEFVNPEWDVITAGRWAGRWDISVGSMTPTLNRAKVLDFPAVYNYTPAAVAVHQDSSAQKPADLSGKVIGASSSTTYELYLEKDLEIYNAPPLTYEITPKEIYSLKSNAVLLDDLRLGDGVRMDGFIGNMTSMLDAIERGYPIRILQPPVFYESLAIATDKGDKELNEKLTAAVAAMHEDGTLTRLSKKWYGVDYSTTQ